MRAIILAAGVGRRLGAAAGNQPKSLLCFGNKSLLQRHLEILEFCGVGEVAIVVGHGADVVRGAIDGLRSSQRVQLIDNPRYREGSMVSLACARQVLGSGEPILLMDADVLYDHRLMRHLIDAPLANSFLLDRDIEPGDEPVKLCIRDGTIVDFRKRPEIAHDWYGESVGFFRFSPAIAAALGERCGAYLGGARCDTEYEEAIRELVIALPPATFGFVDITGLPWIEIDFEQDVARASELIVPRLIETGTPIAAPRGR
ncbi:MAG TPA: phosphocholine cytidylyltransferase family protein [Stellaceae bacterium]|jgi:choline kinase|nr:phosphocholine cytidylyltransferase family protein [Stellaceae bacterium]